MEELAGVRFSLNSLTCLLHCSKALQISLLCRASDCPPWEVILEAVLLRLKLSFLSSYDFFLKITGSRSRFELRKKFVKRFLVRNVPESVRFDDFVVSRVTVSLYTFTHRFYRLKFSDTFPEFTSSWGGSLQCPVCEVAIPLAISRGCHHIDNLRQETSTGQ